MVNVQSLFEYDARVRSRFLEIMEKLPWEEVVKNREASYYSFRNIILHCLEIEDRLLHYIIPGKLDKWVKYDHDSFTDMKSVVDEVGKVEAKTRVFLDKLKAEDLDRVVEFPRKNEILHLRVEDVLIQCITEQLYHRGEIIALLWQMNIEPPPMQWFLNLPTATASSRER